MPVFTPVVANKQDVLGVPGGNLETSEYSTPYTGVGRRACSEASVRFNLKSSGVCG